MLVIETYEQDATILNEDFIQKFDKVLIDVPCLGFGVMKRKPDIKWQRKKEDIEEIIKIQFEILKNSVKYLKVGGEIVYSTCSILKNENEAIIEKWLKSAREEEIKTHIRYEIEKVEKIFGKLSEEAQSQIYQTIINAGQQVSQSIDAIDRDAQDNRQYVANAHQAGEYIKTNGFANIQEDILNKEDKYFSWHIVNY